VDLVLAGHLHRGYTGYARIISTSARDLAASRNSHWIACAATETYDLIRLAPPRLVLLAAHLGRLPRGARVEYVRATEWLPYSSA
jgi:hypothetical protein